MSVGSIAGLIAAVAFLLLVLALAVPLLKLGKLIASLDAEVVRGKVVPLLGETTTTVTSVNGQLERADAITANVQSIATNASALTSLFSATVGGPLVKVAAFSYGVRKAAAKREQKEITADVKAARKAARKSAR